MPRGAKRDVNVTNLLSRNGLLLDKDSFLGWRENMPHLYLKREDILAQRRRVWERDKSICRKCKRRVDWENGEMHHVLSKGKGGSDDLSNLEWRCGRFVSDCHTAEHVQVQWTKRKTEAHAEFDRINPKETT